MLDECHARPGVTRPMRSRADNNAPISTRTAARRPPISARIPRDLKETNRLAGGGRMGVHAARTGCVPRGALLVI